MHLISSLASGIRGAENGTARFFVRATSTRAVFYEDFIGNVHPNSGTDLTLDENGRALVYVNQFVDVTVLDVDGTEVLSFTEGYSAPNIEVTSNSLTGTDYTTGASGPNKPTNLQSAMDLWKTTNGAIDWKVLFGGSAISIQEAVAGVAGLFINVKDPTYGAVGDGVADDTTPIQNAITAAATPKSIVVFPSGTYRTTSKLTIPAGVSLWGLGPECSVITIDHATADTIEFSGGSATWFQEVRNLRIKASQANTGKLVSVVSNLVALMNCTIGDSAHTGIVINCATGFLNIDRCSVVIYTSAASGAIVADSASRLNISDSFVSSQSSTFNGSLVSMYVGTLTSNRFSLGSMTAGTAIGVSFSATTQATVIGNTFEAGASTDTAMAITSNTSTTQFVEAGNVFTGTWTTTYSGFNMGTNNPLIQMVSREAAIRNVSSNSSPLALDGHLYGTVVVTRTAAGAAQSFTSTVGPPGAFLTVVVYNNSGGVLSADPTFDTGFYPSGITITKPSDGKVSIAHFRAVFSAGTGAWTPLAAFKTDF